MTDLYGTIIGADDVRAAAKAHAVKWLPAYLAQIGRQHDVVLPLPGRYEIRQDAGLPSRSRLPAVLFHCEQLRATEIDGDGNYWARALLDIDLWVMADTDEHASQLVGRYAKAVRAAFLQHRTLDGFAVTTRWVEEAFTDPAARAGDQPGFLAIGSVGLQVDIADVVNVTYGPSEPPQAEPPDDAPVVATVTVTNRGAAP